MALADTAALVASLVLEDKFSKNADKFNSTLTGMEHKTNTLGRIGNDVSRGLGRLTTNLLTIGTIASGVVVGGIIASVNAASDLNEEIDKSKVVFGDASDEVIKFSQNAATIGLSTAEALGAAGAFGNMFNTIGLAQEESADMSTTMVQLAADMASFNNEDPSEMLDRLRSGLSGEAEPLRRFGILLSETAVKEFAYRTGIVATGEALTEQQKVQARYGLILEQTAIQQGNFALTSKSLANQQRVLRANLKNTAAVIGTAFLPPLARISAALNEAFIAKQPQITAFAERLGTSLEAVFTDENIQTGIDAIGDFVDKLSEGDVSGLLGDVKGFVSGLASLPWAAIGDAAKLLGTGSRALLDAFLGMPPWVQTAVLTGWGLNKLTGGALGSIAGTVTEVVGKALLQKLGLMSVQAGVVNVNGPVAGGPGAGPGAGGGGFGALGALAAAFAIALPLHQLSEAGVQRNEQGQITFDPVVDWLQDIFNIESESAGLLREVTDQEKANQAKTTDSLTRLREGVSQEERQTRREQGAGFASQAASEARASSARGAEAAQQLQKQAQAVMHLQQIAAKNFSPTVAVTVTSNVSISDVQRRITSQQIAIGRGPLQFE